MVGKYIELPDAYKSVNEALKHAGLKNRLTINIEYVDSQDLESKGVELLSHLDAILVPGGFGGRGVEGKILAAKYARENKVPYLGICLGMQVALIEYARNVAGLTDANSTEFNAKSAAPVVGLITEWLDAEGKVEVRDEKSDLGDTMRLGAQKCHLAPGSKVHEVYGSDEIVERHRHRYEFNAKYKTELEAAGLKCSGVNPKTGLVEIVEIPTHPFFIGVQYHPEYKSTVANPHPLFVSFVQAMVKNKK